MHITLLSLSVVIMAVVLSNIVPNKQNERNDSISTLTLDEVRIYETRTNNESNINEALSEVRIYEIRNNNETNINEEPKWISAAILALPLHTKNHFTSKNTKAISNELEGDNKIGISIEMHKESDTYEDLFK